MSPEPEIPAESPAPDAGWWRRNRADIALIGFLWVVCTLVTWQLAIGHVGPRRFQDEFLWFGVAKSFAAGDGLLWRGVDLGIHSPLYVFGIAPAFWLADSVQTIYHTIHFLNAAMISAVVFPVYFGARQFMDRNSAFITALFAIAVPGMNYAGIIGTEVLAYPMAALAMVGIVMAAARPTRGTWTLAIAGVGLAALTRTQFIVFAPILFAAVVLTGAMRAPSDRAAYFRAQRFPLVLLGGSMLVGALFLLINPGGAVGLYQEAVSSKTPTRADLWYWLKGFTADVFIVAGIIPVIAAIAMSFDRENRRDPKLGALLATALVASVVFVLEVAWFSANNEFDWRARHVFYERYMFYLGPIFFIAFFTCWKRMQLGHVLVATGLAMAAVWGLHADAVLVPFSYDAFGMTLFGWALDDHPQLGAHLGLYVACLTALFGWVLAGVTVQNETVKRLSVAGSVILALTFLFWNQAKTWQYARFYSPIAFSGVPKPVDWIDRATDQPVGVIVTKTDQPDMYFASEFWNKRIVRAFATDAEPFKSPVMYSPNCSFDWSDDGTILGTGCDLVPSAFYIRSPDTAVHLKNPVKEVKHTPDQRLLIGKRPVQMISILSGRDVNTGEVAEGMQLRSFSDQPAILSLTASTAPDAGMMLVGERKFDLPRRGSRTVALPIAAGNVLTEFTFVDRRRLGVPAKVKRITLTLADGRRYDLR